MINNLQKKLIPPPLPDSKGTKYIQKAVGSFLFYSRALNSIMLPDLNDIRTQQAVPTLQSKEHIQQLLDYVNTYPNDFLRYNEVTCNYMLIVMLPFYFSQRQEVE